MTDQDQTIVIDRKDGIIDLWAFGQKHLRQIHRNLTPPELYEHAVVNREGLISREGALVTRTGDYGECPLGAKAIVREELGEKTVVWGDGINEMSADQFQQLAARLAAYIQDKDIYVQYCHVGRPQRYQAAFRFVTETAWHSLYVRNMYRPVTGVDDFSTFDVDYSILHLPGFKFQPENAGAAPSAAVIINLGQKVAVVCGNHYAGEIKQTVFSVLNYLVPREKILLMRCAANVGPNGEAAVFVGRGGSGKTTLATDPERRLIGDHIHGWDEAGLFNFEQGGYAKLSQQEVQPSPLIERCARQFGTILENVAVKKDGREIDTTDIQLADNIRAAYPLDAISGAVETGTCGHPRHLFLLTCDALGVLPPLARLTPDMAVYAFMSGYTSRLDPEFKRLPKADINFATCFGATSLTLPAHIYGGMLKEKIEAHGVRCWLMNTGWVGNPSHESDRVPVDVSRKLIQAVVAGALETVAFEKDPIFGYDIPTSCPGVPDALLNPRAAAADGGEYELRANQLAKAFMNNFSRYEHLMPDTLRRSLSEVLSPDDSFDLLECMGFSM